MDDVGAAMTSQNIDSFDVMDLGRMDYAQAFEVQKQTHAKVHEKQTAPTLLFVEHPPVITITRRPEAREHLLATEKWLANLGVQVCETDRGGDITYHGPGQIVVYPIIPLHPKTLNLRQYVFCLEEAISRTLRNYGIESRRDRCAVGVWVDPNDPAKPFEQDENAEQCTRNVDGAAGLAKIAAIGVRVRRWVTMHGLALNVNPDLEHFKLIVPCGLAGRPVTSMHQLLGSNTPTIDNVKTNLREQLIQVLQDPPKNAVR